MKPAKPSNQSRALVMRLSLLKIHSFPASHLDPSPITESSSFFSIERLFHRLTFKRRESTIENQLKIAKLALVQNNGWELLGLSGEFVSARGIASEKVLEDTA